MQNTNPMIAAHIGSQALAGQGTHRVRSSEKLQLKIILYYKLCTSSFPQLSRRDNDAVGRNAAAVTAAHDAKVALLAPVQTIRVLNNPKRSARTPPNH